MEQNKINYLACIGLFDYKERSISFNKSVYDLSEEDLKQIKFMYCRSLDDEEIVESISQIFIKDVLNDPNTFVINKYNDLYQGNEFYMLFDLLAEYKLDGCDDLTIKNNLTEISKALDMGNSPKSR